MTMGSKRVENNLRRAVETMRNACDEAERAINNDPDANAVQRVFHAMSWGFANAGSGIETAMAALEDAHLIRAMHAAEKASNAGGERR